MGVPTYDKVLIGGIWEPAAGGTYQIVNPATEELAGLAPQCSIEQVQRAARAARAAFARGPWPRMSGAERGAALSKAAELFEREKASLVDLTMAETGALRLVAETQQIGAVGIRLAKFAALAGAPVQEPLPPQVLGGRQGAGLAAGMAVREPIGVVACITPYQLSDDQLRRQDRSRAGVRQHGGGETRAGRPARRGRAVSHGRLGAAARRGELRMRLGTGDRRGALRVARDRHDLVHRQHRRRPPDTGHGGAPHDAHAARARRQVAEPHLRRRRARQGAGQRDERVDVPQRSDLHRRHAPADRSLDLRRGHGPARRGRAALEDRPPDEQGVAVGPLVSAAQRERVERYIARGVDEGATLACGGKRPAHLRRGYYIEPTLFTGVRNDMTIAREEIFGPVLTAIPFRDEDEAIAIANDSDYGLYGYVWTGDTARGLRVAGALRTGTVQINGSPMTATPRSADTTERHRSRRRQVRDAGVQRAEVYRMDVLAKGFQCRDAETQRGTCKQVASAPLRLRVETRGH